MITDPLPTSIAYSGLEVSVEDWVVLPPSDTVEPFARLSTFREAPDGSGRIFVNDLRGTLWNLEDGIATSYADLSELMPEFLDAPGLGTGFQSIAFHPQFTTKAV